MFFESKDEIFSYLLGIFCACLIISNVIASKTFALTPDIALPCAVLIFPIVYIVNDVLAEVFGYKKARRVIILGFLLNLLAVIMYNITMILPAPVFFTGSEAYQIVLDSTSRVLLASFLAYLVGSLMNAKTMVILKEHNDSLFIRCITSTFIGEGCDALIFITIAFYGTMPLVSLLLMIVVQAIFKTAYEIVIYPVTRLIIAKIKAY